MMLNDIRNNLKRLVGKQIKFRFNGSRNQVEEFNGVIDNVYSAIFTIRLLDSNYVKSFSYNDFLIGNLEIIS